MSMMISAMKSISHMCIKSSTALRLRTTNSLNAAAVAVAAVCLHLFIKRYVEP